MVFNSDPDRLDVGLALVRQAYLRQVAEIEDHQSGVLATAVVAPLRVPAIDAVHDDAAAVGRESAVAALNHLKTRALRAG